MRLAVIQHARRATAREDTDALTAAVRDAVSHDAEVVIVPRLPHLSTSEADDVGLAIAGAGEDAVVMTVRGDTGESSGPERGVELARGPLGMTAALTGDECLDPLIARELALAGPDAVVMRPDSESDLQAEAILERALGMSQSVCGLVIVCDADGSPDGEPGHGGSAIVVLGDVAGEAMGGDDVLLSDVDVPIARPEPRAPIPELPPILAQRLALHHGERVQVDYPADTP